MRLQKTKVLAGTTLSVLLSLVAVYPALARPSGKQAEGQALAQIDRMNSASMRGTIKSIVGNVVTLEMPNGETKDVMIGRAERDRLGLRPGMEIMTSMKDGNLMVEVVSAGSASSTSADTTSTEAASEAEMTTRTEGRRVVEETTIRRSTTTPSSVQQTTEQTTGDMQESRQVVDQNTESTPDTTSSETTQPSRPVRALW
ncbi:hypothetical protein LAY57_04765 [Argonema antarcticum A004/B2]|nr:hypothetical protein [Argonema antarcticum A004/B2]